MEKEIAIVYMVAGLSSRFGGRIKQFAKVGPNEETLIELSLNQALKAGFTKIIFIVGNKTEKPFKNLFKDSYSGIPICYALQSFNPETRDKPWGTTDALCSIKKIIDCPFVICNGDDLYGENTFRTLVEHLTKNNELATMGYKLIDSIPEIGATNRGIFKTDENNNVQEIKEIFNIEKQNLQATNTKPDDLCSMNIYALYPETINMLNSQLEFFKKENQRDRKIECLLPEEISKLIKIKKIKMKLYPAQDKWIGVTNPEDEEIVREFFQGQNK